MIACGSCKDDSSVENEDVTVWQCERSQDLICTDWKRSWTFMRALTES